MLDHYPMLERVSICVYLVMDSHLKIRINSLNPKRPTTFDLFIRINEKMVLYLKAGDALDAGKINKLHETGQEVFYIRDADRAEFKKYIHNQISDSGLDVKE